MKVKFKKLSPDAIMPKKASLGAAAFDLYASEVIDNDGYAATLNTGLAAEIPPGHAMFIFSRSGHGFNHGIRLANCVGVIDSDYRGEIKVKLACDSFDSYEYLEGIKVGDRVAQFVIMPIPEIELEEVAELSPTIRGTSGLGSTGNR